MERLPKVVASTVVRSAHQGESHGGVYLVDLQSGDFEQVIDYDDPSISWQGRGGPRGLRGIAFYEGEVYLTASDEIFVYSPDFRFQRSIRNKHLSVCHETHLTNSTLYVTSTGRDSVLEYDLRARSFVKGYHVSFRGPKRYLNAMGYRGKVSTAPMPNLRLFDPNSDGSLPDWSNTCHLNNAFYSDEVLYTSGTRCAHLLAINGSKLRSHARINYGTHNTRPFGDGVLMNDTRADLVRYLPKNGKGVSFPVKRYDEQDLLNADLPQDHARQGFGRGLCDLGEGLLAGGSSPASVSVYDLNTSEVVKTVNLTMDVRNAVHGLEVWPF